MIAGTHNWAPFAGIQAVRQGFAGFAPPLAMWKSREMQTPARDALEMIDFIYQFKNEAAQPDAPYSSDLYNDAIERLLMIVSEAAARMSARGEVLDPSVDWNEVVRWGDTLQHDYDIVDAAMVSRMIEQLPPLRAACERGPEGAA